MNNQSAVLLITTLLITSICNTHKNQKVIVHTVPKSGTHLLAKCVRLITGKKRTPDFSKINWGKVMP